MGNEYNSKIAEHYQGYRPPLHEVILAQCLMPGVKFANGLDIGSGAGQSTVALAAYCSTTTGVEPAEEMLSRAIGHPNVKYLPFDGYSLPVGDHTVDIVTFAGSLFYAKSQSMLEEVIRVATAEAVVIVYDFELLFQQLPYDFDLPEEASDYDHRVNFSGLNLLGLQDLGGFSKNIGIELTAKQLAHLLLSSNSFYQYFLARYSSQAPYDALVRELSAHAGEHKLRANIFASLYVCL